MAVLSDGRYGKDGHEATPRRRQGKGIVRGRNGGLVTANAGKPRWKTRSSSREEVRAAEALPREAGEGYVESRNWL
ncbi:hypothetical protein ACHAXA_007119 [Cyclostephanos tholiformis]|uniref:Uncharacterized protein n=1 Tax=Cyclostephanos tholiformis TaxID=382380 RepID=A0ABD3RYG7_9STRA